MSRSEVVLGLQNAQHMIRGERAIA